MQLSEHFTLEELCHTDTGLPNEPVDYEVEKLRLLATSLLEPIREKWGPTKINSGYRSALVNTAVGGVETSQHRLAEAADIEPLKASLAVVYDWITKNLHFGQCIIEDKHGVRWIHISLQREGKKNNECLVATMIGKKMQYVPYTGVA